MSGADEPVEFKAVRSRLSPAAWLAERGRRDAQIYAGFSLILIPCGVAAAIGLFAVAFGVLEVLNLATCGVWKSLVALLAVAATAGLFYYGIVSARDGRRSVEVLTTARGLVELRLTRLTGSSWMMLFENSDDLNPFVRTILNVALLPPRLFLMSRRTWRLAQRMRSVDSESIGRAADLLMTAGRAVPLTDFLDEFPQSDPQTLIDDITALDGVVLLLTAETPGLTVTPSFLEDYEAWRKQARKRRRPE